MPANLENSAMATGLEKVSFHSNPKERQCQRMLKMPDNCTHLTCQQSNVQNPPSQASTACKQWTSWCWSWFYKKGTRDQITNIHWIIKKARQFQKIINFCFIVYPKPLTVWITIHCGKFWKRWEYQTIWPASWETCMQVRKQQLELDMEQQTGSK